MCVLPVIHFTLANKKLLIQVAGWKDLGKGLGLGLAISSNIISELGGILQGKNLSSNGAEFKITLPLFDPSKITVRATANSNSGIET